MRGGRCGDPWKAVRGKKTKGIVTAKAMALGGTSGGGGRWTGSGHGLRVNIATKACFTSRACVLVAFFFVGILEKCLGVVAGHPQVVASKLAVSLAAQSRVAMPAVICACHRLCCPCPGGMGRPQRAPINVERR